MRFLEYLLKSSDLGIFIGIAINFTIFLCMKIKMSEEITNFNT